MNKEYDFIEIQKSVEKTSTEIKNTLDSIVKKPLIKRIMHKISPKSEFKELEFAFEMLKGKATDLLHYNAILSEMEKRMQEEQNKLIEIMENEKDPEQLYILKSTFVQNQEMLQNQIPIVSEMISTLLTKLEKTLPSMEASLKKKTLINTSLKSLAFLIDNIVQLEEMTKNMERENAKMIEDLVSSTNEKILMSMDIEYYKEMNERNKKLQRIYQESKEKYHKRLEEITKELDNISQASPNLLIKET